MPPIIRSGGIKIDNHSSVKRLLFYVEKWPGVDFRWGSLFVVTPAVPRLFWIPPCCLLHFSMLHYFQTKCNGKMNLHFFYHLVYKFRMIACRFPRNCKWISNKTKFWMSPHFITSFSPCDHCTFWLHFICNVKDKSWIGRSAQTNIACLRIFVEFHYNVLLFGVFCRLNLSCNFMGTLIYEPN